MGGRMICGWFMNGTLFNGITIAAPDPADPQRVATEWWEQHGGHSLEEDWTPSEVLNLLSTRYTGLPGSEGYSTELQCMTVGDGKWLDVLQCGVQLAGWKCYVMDCL
jgi:hypothetical protein